MAAQQFDVIIIGAGMSGATLACALAGSGFQIALLDKKPSRRWREQEYGVRVSAVNLATQKIFESLEVWESIARRRVSPFRDIRVWSDTGSIHFSASEISQTHLGHVIENSAVTSALIDALAKHSDVTLLQSTGIKKIEFDNDGVSVISTGNSKLHGQMLVGADGSASPVREAVGITKSIKPYKQKAIVAQVRTERSHAETAWQRFLSTGPLAFLPLANGSCSIVWSCDNDAAGSVLALDDASFMEELGEAIEHRLGTIIETGSRRAFTLTRQDSTSYIAMRTALIGDAAHVIHPLAGLGANLGITDAACLAQVLSDAREQKRDIGSRATLRRFERWRKGDNALVSSMMDVYKNIFGSSNGTIRRVAGTGLDLANIITPVKHALMRQATGITGDLPIIARQSSIC